MSPQDPLTLWLLGEGPEPEDAADFLEVEPPAELLSATLAAVEAERAAESVPELTPANAPHRTWRWVGLAAAAAAAALLVVGLQPGPEVGDPSQMVARGNGETEPMVVLKMAVEHEGALERLREGSYPAGDRLFFRVSSDMPGYAALVRVDADRIELLDHRALKAGEADLTLDGSPMAWTLEPGDPSSVFALLGSSQPIEIETLDAALRTRDWAGHADDADTICVLASQAGLRCDAAWVGVEP